MENQISLEQARNLIYSHDLSPTIRRMVLINKWSEKHAREACQQYRNYLFLKKKYGKQYEFKLPPSIDIDEVWHAHILHTENYYEFCKKIFGEFLHHHPHHGKDNEITDQELEQMFEETQKLYIKEFGEYIYEVKPLPLSERINGILKKLKSILKIKSSRKVSVSIINS